MGWLGDLWSRATRWLEEGTRQAAARKSRPAPLDAEPPWEPGSVAVLAIEPTLDLHHFHPRDVPSVVAAYLEAAQEAGLDEVLVIHGRGKGVQRSVVAKVLSAHPLVESWGAGAGAAGRGATVARLRRVETQHKTKTSRSF